MFLKTFAPFPQRTKFSYNCNSLDIDCVVCLSKFEFYFIYIHFFNYGGEKFKFDW